jgi:hypothetical protein
MLEMELLEVRHQIQFHLEIIHMIAEQTTPHFLLKVSQLVNFILYLVMKFFQTV